MQKWPDCKPGKRRATSCFLTWRHAGACRGNRDGWWTMLLALAIMSRSCSFGISFLRRLYSFSLSFPPLSLSLSCSRHAHSFALRDKFVCMRYVFVVRVDLSVALDPFSLSPNRDCQSCLTFCIFKRSINRVLILLGRITRLSIYSTITHKIFRYNFLYCKLLS